MRTFTVFVARTALLNEEQRRTFISLAEIEAGARFKEWLDDGKYTHAVFEAPEPNEASMHFLNGVAFAVTQLVPNTGDDNAQGTTD